ncbi:hypothetical protein D3C84_1164020 [compost metagenome]
MLRCRTLFIRMENRGRADHRQHGGNFANGVEHRCRKRIDTGHQQTVDVMQATLANVGKQCLVRFGGVIQSGQFLIAQLDGLTLRQVGAKH